MLRGHQPCGPPPQTPLPYTPVTPHTVTSIRSLRICVFMNRQDRRYQPRGPPRQTPQTPLPCAPGTTHTVTYETIPCYPPRIYPHLHPKGCEAPANQPSLLSCTPRTRHDCEFDDTNRLLFLFFFLPTGHGVPTTRAVPAEATPLRPRGCLTLLPM